MIRILATTLCAAQIALSTNPVGAQEVTLRAITAFAEGTWGSKNFERFIEKVNKDVVEGLQDPALQDRMAKQGGVLVITSSPKQFDEMIKSDTARYTKIFQDAGLGAQ